MSILSASNKAHLALLQQSLVDLELLAHPSALEQQQLLLGQGLCSLRTAAWSQE